MYNKTREGAFLSDANVEDGIFTNKNYRLQDQVRFAGSKFQSPAVHTGHFKTIKIVNNASVICMCGNIAGLAAINGVQF